MVLGTRKVSVCKATCKSVIMEYVGRGFVSDNGHKGWLCLHHVEETDTDEGDALLDKASAEAFLAGAGLSVEEIAKQIK
jgi:hypothetical protein